MKDTFRLALALIVIASTAQAAPAKPRRPAPPPAAAAPSPVAAPTPPPPVFYDFKGARLGMSLDDWNAATPPALKLFQGGGFVDSSETPERVCNPASGAFASDEEKALGVIVCYYKLPDRHFLPIGSMTADTVLYSFLDGKLYKIEVDAKSYALDEVMSGLTAKFGAPSSTVDDTTQNRAGATFPHHERIWANPAATVLVESPFDRIDSMAVIYETTEGQKRLEARRIAAHPAAEKM